MLSARRGEISSKFKRYNRQQLIQRGLLLGFLGLVAAGCLLLSFQEEAPPAVISPVNLVKKESSSLGLVEQKERLELKKEADRLEKRAKALAQEKEKLKQEAAALAKEKEREAKAIAQEKEKLQKDAAALALEKEALAKEREAVAAAVAAAAMEKERLEKLVVNANPPAAAANNNNNAKANDNNKNNNKQQPKNKEKKPKPSATGKSVVCGGHKAASCAECPQGNGATWCNGECTWCLDNKECVAKDDFCPRCMELAAHDEQKCKTLPADDQCSWCPITTQCLYAESFCPTERVYQGPEPEPWFTPPDPIDTYGKTLSIVLPCGSENDFFERTIRSVYEATPPEVLKEIIVVDDNSDPPLQPLFTLNADDYKVKFIRSDVSLGLIDAKHQGALAATGDIIVFFDCHVKPALGYWEPFVREIAENPKRVVVPSITNLDVDTWTESGRPKDNLGGNSKCYTTMNVDFHWIGNDKPWVPTMSGGLLAIDREWFFQIGGHDQAMKGWGGENIDLSFRIWRCGGEIIAATQSYVGHMWRLAKPNTKAKYKIPANSVVYNRARAMKAHAPAMFGNKTLTYPEFQQWKSNGGSDLDVETIATPMRDLQCKDFDWYLDFFSYIYRDCGIIPKEVFQLTPDDGTTCLMLKNRQHWSSRETEDELVMGNCTSIPGVNATTGTQYWHDANRNKKGNCCSGLQAWNTNQCIAGDLKTFVCDTMFQHKNQLANLAVKKGWLKVGTKCLNVNPLSLTNCQGGSPTKTWKKLRPFQPPEFIALSKELQKKW